MLVALMTKDKPGALQIRMDTRRAHDVERLHVRSEIGTGAARQSTIAAAEKQAASVA